MVFLTGKRKEKKGAVIPTEKALNMWR